MTKKSVLCLVIVITLMAVSVSARNLTADQQSVTKIQTGVCKFGAIRCYMDALQECDGTAFVTRLVCRPREMCDVKKGGCIRRIPLKRQTILENFYEMRLTECKEGRFECLGRFVKVCRNHIWMQEFCPKDSWCHPEKGCVELKKMTLLKKRELYIPAVPKVQWLQYK